MKLYPVPGGTWVGTEADWKKAMKAKGLNPKEYSGARDVPTAKGELMEFLNFFAVDVFRTGDAPDTVVAAPAADRPDLEALRAQYNPDTPGTNGVRPSDLVDTSVAATSGFETSAERAPTDLDTLFDAAPIGHQLDLAKFAIARAREQLTGQA